ncbi:MAG: glycosyltransferase family 2 protein [Phycisphaerales bacterium]|nr:glycosyltransferase family 2 protein [Hyphomonadaceae bacterium]
MKPAARPHGLPGKLIVSLTSFPPRYPTLALTLKRLLSQSVKPDAVVLWLTPEEAEQLPRHIKRLPGLTIELAPELRSFKKIIPALSLHADAFIATADDDVFYPHTWLEELVRAYRPDLQEIPCHRAHRIRLTNKGAPRPYADWRLLDQPEASALVFATGVGGALFPPRSLHSEARDAALFTKLCPTSDDAWLYWMARRAGWRFRKVGRRRHFQCWPGSQHVALMHENTASGGGNDRQVAALVAHFGFPPPAPPAGRDVKRAASRW